jgi:hypothetical protein
MNLFINLYKDNNKERQAELDRCLSINIANILIERIYCVVDDEYEVPITIHEKMIFINHRRRPSYMNYFAFIDIYGQNDAVNCIANSDIYFDEDSVRLIEENIHPDECYALSRWDDKEGGIVKLFNRADSQDVWAFRGKVKQVNSCRIYLGTPGCDNAIAHRLDLAGYTVTNPSKDIRTYHLHNSGVRNYTPKDRVPPPYKLIHPHNLPKMNWIREIALLKDSSLNSQYSEDAIISHVFKNIGVTNKFFVDLGAGAYDGKMSNTRTLKSNGWDGFGVDCTNITDEWIIKEFVKPDNVCQILASQNTPTEFDFLNLDLDSSDYWVLQNVLKLYSPRLICTEFNGTLMPDIPVALEYEEGYTWDNTNKYGYSYAAGKKLLEQHGYVIVFNLHDTNIFAIKSELIKDLQFPTVGARRNIYHPINNDAKWIAV